ncbi:hypothetical protein ACFX4N_26850 [Priestia sp. YIM B13551]
MRDKCEVCLASVVGHRQSTSTGINSFHYESIEQQQGMEGWS